MAQLEGFVKNFFFEQGKKLWIIGISLAYTYLIANFLGPEEYGLVTYFISFVASLTNLFGVYFLQNVFQTFNPRYKSRKFFWLLIKLQLAVVLLIGAAIWLFASDITMFLEKKDVFLLQASVLTILTMPAYMSFLFLMRTFKQFKKTMVAEIIMNSSNLCLALILVVALRFGGIGVIYAQFMASMIALAVLYAEYRRLPFEDKEIEFAEITKFSVFSLPTSFMSRAYDTILNIVLGLSAGAAQLGYFYIIQKIANVFIGTGNSELDDVLHPYVMEKSAEKKTLENFISMNIKASILLALGLGAISTAAAYIFVPAFLPKYAPGLYLLPLFVLAIAVQSATAIGQIFISINRIEFRLATNIISLIVCIPYGFLVAAKSGLPGTISLIALYAALQGGISYYFAKRLGYSIEIIPRPKDAKFFVSAVAGVMLKSGKKRKRGATQQI